MQQRHYLKIFALAMLCVSLLLAVSWLPLAKNAPIASAHAFVIGSDPIDGSTISKAPTMVRIYFNAPISATSQATVLAFAPGSSSGLLVSTDHGIVNPTNARELDISLLPSSKLPQGGYEVNWTALSLNDGHTTSGLIGFNLGVSNTGTAGTPTLGPSTSNHFPQLSMQGTLSVAWDWLVTLALLFWVGILITEVLIIPFTVPAHLLAQARKHSRTLQALCLAGLLVGEGINLILRTTSFTQALGSSGIDLNTMAQFVLNTNYGHFWLARVLLLIVALLFFWWSGERQQASASASAKPTTKNGKRMSQLRQQARSEATSALMGTPPPALSTLTPSQARVSGAITANVSQARSTTTSQPRITLHGESAEAPIHQPSFWQNASWLVLAGLILLSLVFSNELLQLAPLPISTGLFSWLSLVAQAIWFGGIAYLGFILLPLLPATNSDQHAEMLIRVLKRSRPFLLAAIGVFLACELFLSEVTIQTPGQLFSDPYGRALLVRESLVALMLILTGYLLFYLLPRLQRQTVLLPVVAAEMPARRARTAELEKTERAIKQALHTLSGVAAVTLICLALMNFFAPPVVFPAINYATPAAPSVTPAPPTSQTQTVAGLTATLTVSPARVGTTNTVQLTLKDAQGNAVSNATVKLTLNMQIMNMGTANATIKGGNTTYTTTFAPSQAFAMAGVWLIQVEIDQPGQKALQMTFHVTAS
ncbi:MAG TPA: FixH family protein [Ktedonobacteraceae bacterium]